MAKINEDLTKERERCSFNIKELTNLMDGGPEKTRERREREVGSYRGRIPAIEVLQQPTDMQVNEEVEQVEENEAIPEKTCIRVIIAKVYPDELGRKASQDGRVSRIGQD